MGKPKSQLDETSLPFATIPQLHTALANREMSCSDLTRFFVKRLEKYGPDYNALACSTKKRAANDTPDVDYAFERSRVHGLLQGIPYGVKDLVAVEGFPTTWGAKPYADQQFDRDARIVDRLDGADAILIGKLSMVELAGGGGYTSASASLQGPGLNPWNKKYWSGGSSSGSGAAVAAGLVPFAIGSETSGSILTPASYCGVSGLRPTYGLVSRHGAMALSWTLDKLGVLAHTADDCGHVLHVIAGKDSDDPGSAGKSFYYTPNWYQKTNEITVGFAEVDWTTWPDEALRPAYAQAFSAVRALGSKMRETRLPDFPYGPVISCIIDAEAASIFETLIRSGQVDQLADPGQIAGLRASLNYSAVDYLKAMRVRSQIQAEFRALFTNVDLLVAPTNFGLPERADQPFDDTPSKHPDQKGVGYALVQAGNLAGLPALTVPCGYVNGLPIGLQIVGPPFSENRILAWARAFQASTSWHKEHPPVGKEAT